MSHHSQSIQELGSFLDMFSLAGKVALSTGAAGGIGRSTAAGFAELGAKVVLMDIPAAGETLSQNVRDIEARYGAEAMYVTGDISDPASVDAMIGQIVERFGTIDVVHNNAGVSMHPDCGNMPFDIWVKEMSIDYTGSFLVARGAAELMKRHGHGGSIITTASMSGLVINSGVCYSAAKAAVNEMSDYLAIDYAKNGIRFNTVCYGRIVSGLHDKFGFADVDKFYENMNRATPIGRMGSLEDAVGCVLYLATELSAIQTGSSMVVDGGACISRRYNF